MTASVEHRRFTRPLRWSAFFLLSQTLLLAAPAPSPSATIDAMMTTLSRRGQFNGAALVAANGKILYRRAFGKADLAASTPLTPDTPFCIASLTKQFTAMAVMMLAQQKKLAYDDPIGKFIPALAHHSRTSSITLRELLNHTSGIPDYTDLDIDDAALTQQTLVPVLLEHESSFSPPGAGYQYSNPGYALLALVIRQASGLSFGDYLDRHIFRPLGMKNTYVYDSPAKRRPDAAIGYDAFAQRLDAKPTAVPGDGGIYSTVDDLYLWDLALSTGKLISPSALAEAYTPGKTAAGSTHYGFGWKIDEKDGGLYVWHTGSTAGFRAFIGRSIPRRITVILLTNQGDSKRTEISDAILHILDGRPYTLPRISGAAKLYTLIQTAGFDAALAQFESLKKSGAYDLGETELNTLGYQLLYGKSSPAEAIAIFRLNAGEHPRSSNAFDSLAEAYRKDHQTALAIENYRKAVALDPSNLHAAAMLHELVPQK